MAMDKYQSVQFLRGQAHECRVNAAMANGTEGRQRWLNSAREYERQADQLEASEAKNTIRRATIHPFRKVASR